MLNPVTETAAAPSDARRGAFRGKARLRDRLRRCSRARSRAASPVSCCSRRGAPQAYARGHVPGALNLPHRAITEEALAAAWPRDALFVVYCAGPHCNAADRAALRLARLGRRVKTMPGGMAGWVAEGFPIATGEAPGRLAD